jgi:hypothetical protein
MRGGLHLFHAVLGFRNFFCQPGNGTLEREQLPAAWQLDWFVEAAPPVSAQCEDGAEVGGPNIRGGRLD